MEFNQLGELVKQEGLKAAYNKAGDTIRIMSESQMIDYTKNDWNQMSHSQQQSTYQIIVRKLIS